MVLEPITREEHFLARIAGDDGKVLEPITREEHFLQKIIDSGGGGSITVDSELSSSSTNPVQNKVIYDALAYAAEIIDGKMDEPLEETISETAVEITPEPNAIYHCGTLTSLTITDPYAIGAYSIIFTSGSTATQTTIPATILGLESFVAEANTLYEINVLDNRAVVGSWAVTA